MRIRDFVKSLHLARNTTWRGNCPNCGGGNSLSITNEGGKLKYNCFRASCNVKGINSMEMSLEDIKRPTRIKEAEPLLLNNCIGWDANIKAYPAVMEYITKNNCLDAYAAYPNRFFYDKIKNRAVFVEYQGLNSFKIAIGRALDKEQPKWYKYVSLMGEYFLQHPSCNSATSAYIVEDCASACSVSRIGWGIALCGTAWSALALTKALLKTDMQNIVVILDKDAQNKALTLQQDLKAFGKFKSVKVATLTDDAKYLSLNKLTKELENV